MKLEVMLSVMNLNKTDLDKMNITCKCTVINQCKKNDFEKYKNFNIYSYNEIGVSNSRNRALEHITEDIILICDDDVIYNDGFVANVISEFESNPDADVIFFNMVNPYRKKRINKKKKRIHFYNCLNYASYNIAFRRERIGNIKVNTLFGPGAKYKSGGDDTIFITDCLKKGLKIYTSDKTIGQIVSGESTWFDGYNEKFFFDKGALYTAISKRYRKLLILQHLLRHREILDKLKFSEAYKMMIKGSKDYIEENKGIKCKN